MVGRNFFAMGVMVDNLDEDRLVGLVGVRVGGLEVVDPNLRAFNSEAGVFTREGVVKFLNGVLDDLLFNSSLFFTDDTSTIFRTQATMFAIIGFFRNVFIGTTAPHSGHPPSRTLPTHC